MSNKLRDVISRIIQQEHATETGRVTHAKLKNITSGLNTDDPLYKEIEKHPELVKFFGKNSETEIPVAGYINGRFVSRRIDRLVIDHENKLVYILDYKTDIDKSTYHEDYIQQINEYVELLRGIYPQYDIQAFILWLNDFSLEKV